MIKRIGLQDFVTKLALFLQYPAHQSRPCAEKTDPQIDPSKLSFCRLLDTDHPMVRLAATIDWNAFEHAIASMWHDCNGRSAIETRLMVALHNLKHTYDLSNEAVVEGWLKKPTGSYSAACATSNTRIPSIP